MRFPFRRAAQIADDAEVRRQRRQGAREAPAVRERLLAELEAAERQNAATQAENLRLLKALTAADRSADLLAAELTSSMTEVADLREALTTARLQNRALRNQISESRYADKLCPGCGQAADDDMDGGTDPAVLTTDLTSGYESVWQSDPTRQEPE